jgi:hypothetical protein
MPVYTYEFMNFDDDITVLNRGPESIDRAKNASGDRLSKIIDDCLGGTDVIRDLMWSSVSSGGINANFALDNMAGNGSPLFNYLPRKPKEEINDYLNRVQVIIMTQYLGNTIESLTGLALAKPISIIPEIKKEDPLWAFFENLNLQGSDLREICKEAIEQALKYGHGFFYASTTSPGQEMTIAQDRSRAFISVVPKSNITDFESRNIGGIERVIWCEMKISEEETKEFWADGRWETKISGKPVASGKADAIGIPLFPFYARKTGLWKSSPPFKELAFAQIRDIQKQSALDHGEAFTCFAPFFGSGIRGDEIRGQQFGVNRMIFVENPDAKVQQMPINADGLEQARKGIEDNRSRIFTEGLSFLASEASVQKTATQDQNDRALENSKLINTIIAVESAFNQALTFVGQMTKNKKLAEAYININKELSMKPLTPQFVTELRNLWRDGIIDHKTMLRAMVKGEFIETELDSESMLRARQLELLDQIGSGD